MKKTLMNNVLRLSCALRAGALGAITLTALVLSSQAAVAQATYQYTGKPFTLFSCGPSSPGPGTLDCPNDPAPGNALTSYTATDHVSATLTFDSPLAGGLNYSDVTSVAGFKLTLNDGHQTLISGTASAAGGLIAKVSTDAGGQIIGPWLLVINEGNAADSGIASENEPPVQPFVQDTGTLACCDPTIQGDIAINQFAAGTWGSGAPSPAQQISSLITLVQQMQIPQQGTSLTDQLQQVATDITAQNGLACQDLNTFASHVKAQTGKKITTAQSNQILTAVASLAAVPKCGS
jgi:hypothetical protein